jgi:hypothetical protein
VGCYAFFLRNKKRSVTGHSSQSSFALHSKKAKKDFSQHFFFSPEALAFYLAVFDLSIMRLIIFVFKQERSEKKFIFFSVYPLLL